MRIPYDKIGIEMHDVNRVSRQWTEIVYAFDEHFGFAKTGDGKKSSNKKWLIYHIPTATIIGRFSYNTWEEAVGGIRRFKKLKVSWASKSVKRIRKEFFTCWTKNEDFLSEDRFDTLLEDVVLRVAFSNS